MLEVIKDVASVLGCISIAITLLCTLNKTVKRWIAAMLKTEEQKEKESATIQSICDKLDKYIASNQEFKEKITEDMEVQKDFARDQCRNAIKDIFYRYCDIKKIPLYEYKVAENTFDTYSNKLKGNHYIALLWGEIQKWEIDYTHSFEGEE